MDHWHHYKALKAAADKAYAEMAARPLCPTYTGAGRQLTREEEAYAHHLRRREHMVKASWYRRLVAIKSVAAGTAGRADVWLKIARKEHKDAHTTRCDPACAICEKQERQP